MYPMYLCDTYETDRHEGGVETQCRVRIFRGSAVESSFFQGIYRKRLLSYPSAINSLTASVAPTGWKQNTSLPSPCENSAEHLNPFFAFLLLCELL